MRTDNPGNSPLLNRRGFMGQTLHGLSGIALASLLAESGLLADDKSPSRPQIDPAHPFAARPAHFAPRAKQVLLIFCSGACSQLDTFDYKPELIKRHGQPMPGADDLVTFQGKQGNLTKSPWEFKPRGQCGKMISELVPLLGELADDMCFLHSLTGKTNTHGPGENFMSTGNTLEGFPAVGTWVTWALGTENQELPAYVAIPDPRGTPQSSVNNWGSGFLPAAYQGTDFNATKPLRNLDRPTQFSASTDAATREFLKQLNDRHLAQFPGDSELAARISSYELAARMQLSVPKVTDLASESSHTLTMYGADDSANPLKMQYARNCILARRLIEQGVRFVQLFNGAYQTGGEGVSNWDGHKQLHEQYGKHGPVFDQPTAALLRDMKQRGLLKDTLVVLVHRVWTYANLSSRCQWPRSQSTWLHGLDGGRGREGSVYLWSNG